MTVRPADESKILRLTWEEMDGLHRQVARQIVAAGFVPDVIVGILRCGQVSATHLAYLLGVRDLMAITVRTMLTDAPLESERVAPEITVYAPDRYFEGRNVLLVDAVMESGTTVALCLERLSRQRPRTIKTAMITDWYNSDYKIRSGVRPGIDFAGARVTKWPDFPWEH